MPLSLGGNDLRESVRKSWITKWVALSFISMIICGNIWFVYLFTGQEIPLALNSIFLYTAYSIGGSAVFYIGLVVFDSFRPVTIEEHESELSKGEDQQEG